MQRHETDNNKCLVDGVKSTETTLSEQLPVYKLESVINHYTVSMKMQVVHVSRMQKFCAWILCSILVHVKEFCA